MPGAETACALIFKFVLLRFFIGLIRLAFLGMAEGGGGCTLLYAVRTSVSIVFV